MEIAILDTLSAQGGLAPRDAALAFAFPEVARAEGGTEPATAIRARAEAALSRAIVSLQRKGLVVRERNQVTRRTLLRSAGQQTLPVWELLARAEEDLAAHCQRTAAEWSRVAGRARERADVIRRERSSASTEASRQQDLELLHRLEPPNV